jgi:hypothetical protein
VVYDDPTLLFNAPVTLSTAQYTQLSQLRQDNGFRFAGSYYLNYSGMNEKWFTDRNSRWFVLTPDGNLLRYSNGGFTQVTDSSNHPVVLDPTVYDNPSLLLTAAETSELSELRHDYGFFTPSTEPANMYTDYLGLGYKWFKDRTGSWYVITQSGQLEYWNGGTSFTAVDQLGANVYANPNLLFAASVALTTQAQNTLISLEAAHGFHFVGSYYQSYLFTNLGAAFDLHEKWFQDSAASWWVITPDGQVRQWLGGALLGTAAGVVDPLAYDDPTLLFNAH